MQENTKQFLWKATFFIGIAFCLMPFADPPLALLAGLLISQTIGHPFPYSAAKYSKYLLQGSVVGLGFGMNLSEAAKAGQTGFVFTVCSISLTLLVGLLLGKWLKNNKKISYLVSSGTAICGGSAIAAVGPLIDAGKEEMSIALGIVFILNSIALLIFPYIGHFFQLTEPQFGLWSAIAIHDTSSVVGAAQKYGPKALEVATTVKLERALWIIPLSFFTAFYFKRKDAKFKFPVFILFFIAAMAISTYIPAISPITPYIVLAAKKGMTITLFLIGCGLSRKAIKSVGIKPLLQGVILWVLISVTSLMVILKLG